MGWVAAETAGMSGRVGQFVKRGAVPVDGFKEGGGRRHHHGIAGGHIESAIAADQEGNVAGVDHRLRGGKDQRGGGRRGFGVAGVRKPVALARTGDGWGKGGSVSLYLGGRRIFKKKN